MGLHQPNGFSASATAEELLIDIAGRIQLSQTKHKQAVTHYEALCAHVDRSGSPLEGRVLECYASGSFGIGAVVASRVKADQHDVDVVLELDLPISTSPETVLNLLFQAIKGDPGSAYHRKARLNSRCVTVHYEDGVTVDLMPIVRDASGMERSGVLFHSKDGTAYTKPVNPYGFKTYYNNKVELDPSFARAFRDRVVLVEKANVQPMDDPVRLEEKSPRTVGLQLLKRFRDIRFRATTRKALRKPPSVALAALALEKPGAQPSVLAELISMAEHIRSRLVAADRAGQLIEVRNPAYYPDVFSDRWPANASDQRIFAGDLDHLLQQLDALTSGTFSPVSAKRILEDLFGETAADYALGVYMEHRTADAQRGQQKFSTTGALLTGSVAANSPRAPSRPSTDFGGSED